MRIALIKKIILGVMIFVLNGCYITGKRYYYKEGPINYSKEKTYEFRNYIGITAHGIELENKRRPVSLVQLLPINGVKKLTILNNQVKLIYKNKEYWINVFKTKHSILPYDEGIEIEGDFIVYFGKVKINDNKIIEMPPLLFTEYVNVSTADIIPNLMNVNSGKTLYDGPVKEYK